MSRAAGTLLTTHNATYIPPKFMPGYRGYCPALKFDFGETYGNATAKYFQDYRSDVLTSSKSPYFAGGSFPTYYTHDPDLVISNRTRSHDRWLSQPKYDLSNKNRDRSEELYQYSQLADEHRGYYLDKKGTVYPVAHFCLPSSEDDLFNRNVKIQSFSNRHTDKIYLPPLDTIAKRSPILPRIPPRIAGRERAKRDMYHEKR